MTVTLSLIKWAKNTTMLMINLICKSRMGPLGNKWVIKRINLFKITTIFWLQMMTLMIIISRVTITISMKISWKTQKTRLPVWRAQLQINNKIVLVWVRNYKEYRKTLTIMEIKLKKLILHNQSVLAAAQLTWKMTIWVKMKIIAHLLTPKNKKINS